MDFQESMRSLLSDGELDAAGGGMIIRHGDTYTYRLYGQPDDGKGELFLELAPSSTSEVKWRALLPTEKARQAYRAFVSDPRNGEFVLGE